MPSLKSGQLAALCLFSCGCYTHIEAYVVIYICLFHLSSIRYFCVRGKYRGMLICSHDFYMALCNITLKNVVHNFSVVGHPYGQRYFI